MALGFDTSTELGMLRVLLRDKDNDKRLFDDDEYNLYLSLNDGTPFSKSRLYSVAYEMIAALTLERSMRPLVRKLYILSIDDREASSQLMKIADQFKELSLSDSSLEFTAMVVDDTWAQDVLDNQNALTDALNDIFYQRKL